MMLYRQLLRFFLNFAEDSSMDSSPEKSISMDIGEGREFKKKNQFEKKIC